MFHVMTTISQEALSITQTTKCIETWILTLLAVLSYSSIERFFSPPKRLKAIAFAKIECELGTIIIHKHGGGQVSKIGTVYVPIVSKIIQQTGV